MDYARDEWDDLSPVLHGEIDRLPERYRVTVVLCDLEGKTHDQVAHHLGWPVGTVKSRLTRARELLRGRLSRRGVALSTELLIAGVAPKSGEASLYGPLFESAVQAAVSIAAGEMPAVRVISTRVVLLTEGVLKAMFLSKLKIASIITVMTAAVVAGAVGVFAQQGAGSPPTRTAETPKKSQPGDPRGTRGADRGSAPAYIKQSRKMMITRLEQERQAALQRLDRTVETVADPNDPVVVQARKTVHDLDDLLTPSTACSSMQSSPIRPFSISRAKVPTEVVLRAIRLDAPAKQTSHAQGKRLTGRKQCSREVTVPNRKPRSIACTMKSSN